MKKFFLFLFVTTLFAGSLSAENKQSETALLGEWKFECPNAPYGYTEGSIFFTEKEGELAGHVKFSDGYKIDLKNVSLSDDVFKSGIYVDYEYVGLKATIDGTKMKGTADSSEGDLSFTANKVE